MNELLKKIDSAELEVSRAKAKCVGLRSDFGKVMRETRMKKNIGLRELAREVEVSAAYLSDIELGRRFPSEKVLAKLAQQLS